MRRTTALTMSALSGIAALVVLSPSAQASPAAPTSSAAPLASNGACPENSFCLFEDDNYQRGRAVFIRSNRDLRTVHWSGGSGGPVHDGASSMINNTGKTVTLFANVGCSGQTYQARPNSSDRDLTNNGFDNKADCVSIP